MKDVLIIGSGAGGGALAWALSRAALDVLVLERGPRYSREDYLRHGEVDVICRNIFSPSLDSEPHTVVTRKTTRPLRAGLGWTASCVGGGTSHMGSFLYRFHPDDFRMKSRFGPCEKIEDWPYSYGDLEPYYSQAEWEIGISGQGGANPYEGPRSKPYPMPPLLDHPVTSVLAAACRKCGTHPFPTPRGINSRSYQGRPACAYCDVCSTYGCQVGARGTAQEAFLARAEKTGRCEVRPDSMVGEVTIGRDGAATGCVYLDQRGQQHEVAARAVCVCCSSVESARLLLLSRSPRFPDGLANHNGLVGKNLQFHAYTAAGGKFEEIKNYLEELPRQGRLDANISILDYYFMPETLSGLGKGGLLRFGIATPKPLVASRDMISRIRPTPWGIDFKQAMKKRISCKSRIYFEAFHDFLPNEESFVDLDPQVRDKWGLPVARIHLDIPDHHKICGRWLGNKGLEILEEMGAEDLALETVASIVSHLVQGTCRAGPDPETSTLNPFCQAHSVPNLFVVDGSFMPTSGGAPTTLTIVANSLRTADHIIGRFKGQAFEVTRRSVSCDG